MTNLYDLEPLLPSNWCKPALPRPLSQPAHKIINSIHAHVCWLREPTGRGSPRSAYLEVGSASFHDALKYRKSVIFKLSRFSKTDQANAYKRQFKPRLLWNGFVEWRTGARSSLPLGVHNASVMSFFISIRCLTLSLPAMDTDPLVI